jgi:hypothetical protein
MDSVFFLKIVPAVKRKPQMTAIGIGIRCMRGGEKNLENEFMSIKHPLSSHLRNHSAGDLTAYIRNPTS